MPPLSGTIPLSGRVARRRPLGISPDLPLTLVPRQSSQPEAHRDHGAGAAANVSVDGLRRAVCDLAGDDMPLAVAAGQMGVRVSHVCPHSAAPRQGGLGLLSGHSGGAGAGCWRGSLRTPLAQRLRGSRKAQLGPVGACFQAIVLHVLRADVIVINGPAVITSQAVDDCS
jgi:hypothetical protein